MPELNNFFVNDGFLYHKTSDFFGKEHTDEYMILGKNVLFYCIDNARYIPVFISTVISAALFAMFILCRTQMDYVHKFGILLLIAVVLTWFPWQILQNWKYAQSIYSDYRFSIEQHDEQ